MSIQALTPPQDITWTRMLFSRDMMDTNFDRLNFPPRWRSSFAVYYYIVPEEETVDAYPNSKIVYLKLTSSITGWNPSESLIQARDEAYEPGSGDDLQVSLWEVIRASGWAEKYWPCLGAIIQLAVYPNNKAGVSVDDYPYILDFEPKKRELYESVSAENEILSNTGDNISVSKGSTNVFSAELQGKAKVGLPLVGSTEITAKVSDSYTSINNNVTDTIREKRETVGHTVSFSQMYQLFNGYHLGTNRSLFVIAPRPHTVSSVEQKQIEASLVNGKRKLEGVQDIFFVVHMPKNIDGFCVQASLDTGHIVMDSNPNPEIFPNQEHLVITRRINQACGTFDENGTFNLKKITESPQVQLISGEITVSTVRADATLRSAPQQASRKERIDAANDLNVLQSKISNAMLDQISANNYTPRKFEETGVFKILVSTSLSKKKLPIKQLVDKKIITEEIAKQLEAKNISSVDEIFNENTDKSTGIDLNNIREKILKHLFVKKED